MKDSKEKLFRIMSRVNPEMKLNEELLSHATDVDPVDDYNDEKPNQTNIVADEILTNNPKLQEIVSNINRVYYDGTKNMGLILKEAFKGYKHNADDEAEIIHRIFQILPIPQSPQDTNKFIMSVIY